MQKKYKHRSKKTSNPKAVINPKINKEKKQSLLPWLLLAMGITAICFLPMLRNGFTNWDDELYVVNNKLIPGPDWKGLFTESVAGNYHPLTMITLAMNYAISGLDPFSYQLFDFLLHLVNTALVFYFIWNVSGKKIFVSFLTALIFGIHPLHVESVAWVSERKDVLYTLFFLLSLIQYWKFIQSGRLYNYWICFFLFLLSLLSKPAAITLPLVLFLLDYWKGRPFNKKIVIEKIPFLVMSILSGVIVVKIQSTSAVAGFDVYPVWVRLFFACYVIMTYFFRFFIPYPLSTFHPFPPVANLGWPVLLSPLFILALAFFLWFQRKNKLIVFGFLIFIVNLLLVLQLISIGLTIVSERYTYVPYIGLVFMFSMWLNRITTLKPLKWLIPVAATLIFGIITFYRTQVWKNSNTLWSDVIEKYPNAPVPRTNRANYISRLAIDPAHKNEADALRQQALEDCNIALEIKPTHKAGYETRGLIYLDLNRNKEALADAESLIKLDPENKLGYDIRGSAYGRLNEPEKAFADFNKCLSLSQDNHRAFNNRGALLLNYYKKYSEALTDFNKAISLHPQGNYYLNRSICYFRLNDLAKAKADAQIALQMGTFIPNNYREILHL